jgi:hypothetical protein
MILYGVCIGSREKYERLALPCLERCLEPTGQVLEREHESSIFTAYNAMLDVAAAEPDLEGLVLVHDDLEIVDTGVAQHLRTVFQDESIAVAGVIGARNLRALAWWHFDVVGYVRERLVPSRVLTENRGVPDSGTHEVESVDGIFLALSPWAVRNLRFDTEHFEGFDGYDADICAQARATGKRVVVTEIEVIHNRREHTAYRDFGAFRRADFTWRAKWLDAPRWRRYEWRAHARLVHLEMRVRSWEWVREVEKIARSLRNRAADIDRSEMTSRRPSGM